MVEEDRVGGVLFPQQAQLLPLAGAEVRGRVEPGALLRKPADDLEPARLRELAQLGQRGIELGVACAGQLHGRHDDALHPACYRAK